MNIFFLRHTSLDVEPDVFYGQTDLDVSNTFDEEVKIIKKKINKLINKDYKVKVYSSPLQRCRKLSQKISDNVILDPRIMELNLGDWEMKPKQSIPKELVENWEKDMINLAESVSRFQHEERIHDVLDTIKRCHDVEACKNEFKKSKN